MVVFKWKKSQDFLGRKRHCFLIIFSIIRFLTFLGPQSSWALGTVPTMPNGKVCSGIISERKEIYIK